MPANADDWPEVPGAVEAGGCKHGIVPPSACRDCGACEHDVFPSTACTICSPPAPRQLRPGRSRSQAMRDMWARRRNRGVR